MNSEFLFTLDEVCKFLKISKSTIYKMSELGKIPSIKIGKQLRFRQNSIMDWVKNLELTRKKGR